LAVELRPANSKLRFLGLGPIPKKPATENAV
jgi:hypothetical protein